MLYRYSEFPLDTKVNIPKCPGMLFYLPSNWAVEEWEEFPNMLNSFTYFFKGREVTSFDFLFDEVNLGTFLIWRTQWQKHDHLIQVGNAL